MLIKETELEPINGLKRSLVKSPALYALLREMVKWDSHSCRFSRSVQGGLELILDRDGKRFAYSIGNDGTDAGTIQLAERDI